MCIMGRNGGPERRLERALANEGPSQNSVLISTPLSLALYPGFYRLQYELRGRCGLLASSPDFPQLFVAYSTEKRVKKSRQAWE